MRQPAYIQPILENLETVEDVQTFVKTIDECIEQIYSSKTTIDKTLAHFFSTEKKEVIATIAKERGISITNPSGVQSLLEDLKKQLLAIPTVEVRIGIEPTEDMEETMYSWIEQQLGTKVVLKLIYDSSIIAGAAVSYNGRFGDYTVNKSIEQLLIQE